MIGGKTALSVSWDLFEKGIQGSGIEILDYVWYGGEVSIENPRIIIIKNSLEIENILISESMIKEAHLIDQIEILDNEAFELSFDENGNLNTEY